MKKGLVVALALLLTGALGIFAGLDQEAAAADKTITVGVNSENPPWIFMQDGKMTGFEADILEEFAKRAGYKVDYKSAPFSTVLTGVQSGQWDIAMSSIWIKPERAKVMDFADPYYDSGIGMMTPKGGITDLSQMKGKTFGSDTGSMNEAWLVNSQDKYGPYEVKSYDYWADAVLDLEAGRLDGVVVDDPIALHYIKQHPDSSRRHENLYSGLQGRPGFGVQKRLAPEGRIQQNSERNEKRRHHGGDPQKVVRRRSAQRQLRHQHRCALHAQRKTRQCKEFRPGWFSGSCGCRETGAYDRSAQWPCRRNLTMPHGIGISQHHEPENRPIRHKKSSCVPIRAGLHWLRHPASVAGRVCRAGGLRRFPAA